MGRFVSFLNLDSQAPLLENFASQLRTNDFTCADTSTTSPSDVHVEVLFPAKFSESTFANLSPRPIVVLAANASNQFRLIDEDVPASPGLLRSYRFRR